MDKHAWLLVFILVCASPALAQTPAPPGPRPPADVAARFQAADKDDDGTLDRTEAAAMPGLARKFDLVDTDRDGTVDMKEIEAYHAQMMKSGGSRMERRFNAADKNQDGVLDKTEAATWPGLARRFDAVDTDHDGTVDLEEVMAAMGRRQSGVSGAPASQAPIDPKK